MHVVLVCGVTPGQQHGQQRARVEREEAGLEVLATAEPHACGHPGVGRGRPAEMVPLLVFLVRIGRHCDMRGSRTRALSWHRCSLLVALSYDAAPTGGVPPWLVTPLFILVYTSI